MLYAFLTVLIVLSCLLTICMCALCKIAGQYDEWMEADYREMMKEAEEDVE